MAKPTSPRTVQCYHCRHRFEVSRQTMTTSCPKCSKALTVEDVVIKTAHAVRKIQTCGRLIVQKKGRVIAQSVEAHGGVEVEGILEAKVLSGGPVKIGAKGQWRGDCGAPSLVVEAGGRIDGGYFVIPDDTLGVADLPRE
jgi:hypothetical protein